MTPFEAGLGLLYTVVHCCLSSVSDLSVEVGCFDSSAGWRYCFVDYCWKTSVVNCCSVETGPGSYAGLNHSQVGAIFADTNWVEAPK